MRHPHESACSQEAGTPASLPSTAGGSQGKTGLSEPGHRAEGCNGPGGSPAAPHCTGETVPGAEPGPCLQPRLWGAGGPWGCGATWLCSRGARLWAGQQPLAYGEAAAGPGLSSPAARLQQAVANLQRRHPEVRDPDVILLVQQKVFWFQIPVAGKEGGIEADRGGSCRPSRNPALTTGGQRQRCLVMSPAANRKSPTGQTASRWQDRTGTLPARAKFCFAP